MTYDPRDYYFRKAKAEHFAARSVFKLQEIDDRFRILRLGQRILDLGAAPGSWSQYASKKIGLDGRILGIDLEPIALTLPNAVFVQADLREARLERIFTLNGITPPFDVVLSDMAPKTTGVRITDQTRSLELASLALDTAERFLKPRGSFVCKLFQGGDFEAFRSRLRVDFGKVELLRPRSTRKESKEIFFVCSAFLPPRGAPG
jgi:23S rRNA (uridine2552-2'-O)-methyltransferase